MTAELLGRAFACNIEPNARLLLIVLADMASGAGGCLASLERIHERTGLPRIAVDRLLELLRSEGHISFGGDVRDDRTGLPCYIVHPRGRS